MKQKIKIAKIITVDDYAQFYGIQSNTLVITATQNLKKNNLFNEAKTIMSFADLLAAVQKNIDYKECINSTELRYLIHQVIENNLSKDIALSYKNCVFQLEELYSKLIILGITEKEILNLKLDNYGIVERNIIDIYRKLLIKIKSANQDIIKVQIIKSARDFVNKYDSVVFIGFVFFNDLQEALINNINTEQLVFVNKRGAFIKEDLLLPLLNKLGYVVDVVDLEKRYSNIFSEVESKLFTNERVSVPTGLIDFYEPFSNREEEFIFIAKEISNNIKNRKLDIKQIEEAIQDYAVVLTKNKSELSKILNDALGQYGVFLPDNKLYPNLKSIYYSKQEFLNDNILLNNKRLNYVEKLELFDKFRRIKVLGSTVQTAELPIGKFIIEVYKVVANDLTIDSFKTLINTQWYLNKVADNDAIEDFYKIQAYFEKLTTLESWREQISRLIDLKKDIKSEKNFEMHPLYVVSEKTLKYIQEYLEFIESLTCRLKINANMKQQIQTLIESFGLQNVKFSATEEKEALEFFIASLQSIESNDKINIDYKYFAEHIKELIEEYSNIKEKEKNAIKLAVVNMENYTKFDYVFFPMFEENKYPRILKREFPFTNNIVKILNELGVGIQKNLDINYHLKMSRHIFKNVFAFVNKKIVFTHTCKENESDLSISVYAKDISKATNTPIKFIEREKQKREGFIEKRELIFKKQKIKEVNINELLSRYICPKQFYYMVAQRNTICYKDVFLLNFYAKALIINRFFSNLAQSEKEFILASEEFEAHVDYLFDNSYMQIMKYFDFFSENERRDIRITSKKAVLDFIETHFKSGKFAAKKCKFALGKEKIIKDSFIVKTRHTLLMINTIKGVETEFDISRNLDYLVSSSSGKKYKLEHFAEIIEQIEKGSKFDDKLDLVNFASFKVNTQLNNKRFFEDGIVRTKRIIQDTPLEYSNMGERVSGYCRFCKLKSTCKGVLIDD